MYFAFLFYLTLFPVIFESYNFDDITRSIGIICLSLKKNVFDDPLYYEN